MARRGCQSDWQARLGSDTVAGLSAVAHILPVIEQGDPKAADKLLPLVSWRIATGLTQDQWEPAAFHGRVSRLNPLSLESAGGRVVLPGDCRPYLSDIQNKSVQLGFA